MRELPAFLTNLVAFEAIQRVVLPLLESSGFEAFPFKRKMLHVVVLVPVRAGLPHLLCEYSVGRREDWPYEFDKIAQSKAGQLWNGRNDDRTDIMPHLLFDGDAPFFGGVKRHGIVVACSGVQPWFDKMISGMVADMCIALAYEAWMTSEDKHEDVTFIT